MTVTNYGPANRRYCSPLGAMHYSHAPLTRSSPFQQRSTRRMQLMKTNPPQHQTFPPSMHRRCSPSLGKIINTMKITRCSQPIGLALIALTALFLLVAHADESTNRVSPIRVPGASKVIKAQSGTDGTIHLLFDNDEGPHYANSRDGGLTFSAPMAIVDAAAQKPGLKFSGEDLAVSKDGRVHVAMANNAWKLKLPQEEWSLYYAGLAPGAKAFSPVRNLNRKPSEGFSLAADGLGSVAACFLSGKLFAMVSRDNAETFGASAEINSAWNPCDCCTTSAAYGKDGK